MAKRQASKASRAVRRGHRDQHARLADLEPADAVHDGHAARCRASARGSPPRSPASWPAAIGACASYSRNFTRRPPVWSRTTPEKSAIAPAPGSLDRLGRRPLGERLGRDLDPVLRRRTRRRSPGERGRARRPRRAGDRRRRSRCRTANSVNGRYWPRAGKRRDTASHAVSTVPPSGSSISTRSRPAASR